MSEEIKPCPFCGGEVRIEIYDDCYDDNTRRVSCKNDNCIGAHIWPESESEAIEAWNKRVNP
jgi:Lar family restriction alleviation protein